MSRIWAALPTKNPEDLPPAPEGACWWRRLLPMGQQGHHLIIQTYDDRGDGKPRLGYWEWFDGRDHTLVFGHDVFDVRFESKGGVTYLDLLAKPGPVFSGGPWVRLTSPDNPDQLYPFRPLGFGFHNTPALPYRYAPRIEGDVTRMLDAERID